MKYQEDETKPEGFHTEFKLNVKFIALFGSVAAIVTILIISRFM